MTTGECLGLFFPPFKQPSSSSTASPRHFTKLQIVFVDQCDRKFESQPKRRAACFECECKFRKKDWSIIRKDDWDAQREKERRRVMMIVCKERRENSEVDPWSSIDRAKLKMPFVSRYHFNERFPLSSPPPPQYNSVEIVNYSRWHTGDG